MPLIKRRAHVLELLNIAVNQQRKVTATRNEILDRPASIWCQTTSSRTPSEHQSINQRSLPNSNRNETVPFTMPLARQQSMAVNTPTMTLEPQQNPSHSSYSIWMKLFIRYSRFCEKLLHLSAYRRCKVLLWPMAFAILAYQAPRDNLDDTPNGKIVLFFNILVDAIFMIDAVCRLSGLYIFIRIETAFHRRIKILETSIKSGGIDIVVGILCMVYRDTEVGKWLDLFRLVRITSAVSAVFPHLDVLMNCVHNGFKSTLFTILLLLLLIITYGSVGHLFFRHNDPFHFGTYFISCLTFFQLITFENWSMVYYVNYYGCDRFPGVYQYQPPKNLDISKPVSTQFGSFYVPNCSHPNAQPFAASILFVSYVILAGFCVMSMCLAAVAIGIDERLSELKSISLYGDEEEQIHDLIAAAMKIDLYANPLKRENTLKIDKLLGEQHRKHETVKTMLKKLWDGHLSDSNFNSRKLLGTLSVESIVHHWNRFSGSPYYAVLYSAMILIDAGLQMAENVSGEVGQAEFVHVIIMVLFVVDCSLCYSSKSSMENYLKNKWNIFDVVLTLSTFIPIVAPSDIFGVVLMKQLRLLRLFRILKVLSIYVEELEVVLGAISGSIWAVAYVICIFAVFFAYYAIAGVLLFRKTDPWYFKNVLTTFNTLLQIMTLDNWSNIMKTSIFGCYMYGYGSEGNTSLDKSCKLTDMRGGQGWWAAFYFMSFIVLACMILNSLLVGVIITSMNLLKETQNDEREITKRVGAVQQRYQITDPAMELMLQIFEKLDENGNAALSFNELRPILDIVDMPASDQYAFFVLVDTDHSGNVDFAEFCEMTVLMGLSTNGKKREASKYTRRSNSSQRRSTVRITLETMKQNLKKTLDSIAPPIANNRITPILADLETQGEDFDFAANAAANSVTTHRFRKPLFSGKSVTNRYRCSGRKPDEGHSPYRLIQSAIAAPNNFSDEQSREISVPEREIFGQLSSSRASPLRRSSDQSPPLSCRESNADVKAHQHSVNVYLQMKRMVSTVQEGSCEVALDDYQPSQVQHLAELKDIAYDDHSTHRKGSSS